MTFVSMMKPFLSVSLLALSIACAPVEQSTSGVKYGFLVDYEAPFLIHYPSGSTIRICGSWLPQIRKSLTMWGAAINKTYNIIEDCENADVNGFARNAPRAVELCTKFGSGNGAFADLYGESANIIQCEAPTKYDDRMVLHEVGHLFGLCDLYEGGRDLCSSIKSVVEDSIMFQLQSDVLRQDDIDGIRALEAKLSKDRRDYTK